MTTYNTGNPVGSVDVRDLYDNAENLDNFSNGPLDSYPDRFGVSRQSLQGIRNASQYQVLGPYAAGLQFTALNQVFSYLGEFYAPGPAITLPYTTTGIGAAEIANFRSVGDAVLRQDLADPVEGAGIVAFDLAETYPAGSVGEALRRVSQITTGVLTPQIYGAFADGTSHPLSAVFATLAEAQAVYPHATSLTNEFDWVAAQAVLSAGSSRVHFPGGHYVLPLDLVRDTDIMLTGDAFGTVLDFSSGPGQLLITGSLTAMPQLSVNPSRHERTLTWAVDHGLSPRDVLILWNPTDFSWGGRRAYYRDGAMLRVHSVTSATEVSLYDPCPDAYIAANFNVYKMNYVHATVKDITCIASAATSNAPLELRHCVDSTVSGYSHHGGIYAGLTIDRCYNVSIDVSSPINASPFVDNEYGTVIVNCTHVNVCGKGMYATRHAVSIGGSVEDASPPNRYVRVSNMSLLNGAGAVSAADAHGNSDYTVYDNCFALASASIAGRNPTLQNCVVYGATGSTFASRPGIYVTECNGGTVTLDNVTLHTTGDGNSFGFVHFVLLGPGEDDPMGTGLNSPFDLIVRGVTINAPNAHASAKAVRIVSRNANKSVNVDIDGLTVVAPKLLAFLYLEETVLAAVPGEFINVNNVYGPSGARIVYPVASIAARATKEMAQSGNIDASITTASGFVNAAAAPYRYIYSRTPTAQVTHGSIAPAVAKQLWGGKRVVSYPNTLTATAVVCAAATTDAAVFASTDDIRFHYTVSVG